MKRSWLPQINTAGTKHSSTLSTGRNFKISKPHLFIIVERTILNATATVNLHIKYMDEKRIIKSFHKKVKY